ncbi:MAG: DNA-binding MarR family transcriptional regulator [Hyphomicrobiaceae bacterium]|jgi:DNA-binding MarR family transcriptional regulator
MHKMEKFVTDDAIAAAALLERISQLTRTEEQNGDLYPAQWTVLRFLARANRFSRNPMAITHYMGSTRGTVSQTVIALERKGYVARTPSMRDKRSVDVEVTESGVEKLAADPILKLAEEVRSALGEQPKQARTMLEKILANLVAANGGRPFGQCRTCRHFKPQSGTTKGQPHHCGLLEEDLSETDSDAICVEQVA